jgi:hypothetical protein
MSNEEARDLFYKRLVNIHRNKSKKYKHLLLLLSIIICSVFYLNNYLTISAKHEQLLKSGLKSKIVPTFYSSWGNDYVDYYFITNNGQKITATERTSKGEANYNYLIAHAIYNPQNPNEYELSYNFNNYSDKWILILNLFIAIPVSVFLLNLILNLIWTVYLLIKDKSNRKINYA